MLKKILRFVALLSLTLSSVYAYTATEDVLIAKGNYTSDRTFSMHDFADADNDRFKYLSRSMSEIEQLEKAAALGDAAAQVELGVMYLNGEGVTQDYAKAKELFEKAAAQGNAVAQNYLGDMYYNGKGVTQDYLKAKEWYEKAATQGNAAAQNNLGALYHLGHGVTQDYVKAREWYEKAAAQGNATAQTHLGYLYEYGLGITANYDKARELYEDAAAQGYVPAVKKIMQGTTRDVDGHFMHYGNGPYDWVYITIDGSLLAKLTGLDPETGYLTWENLGVSSFSYVRVAETGKFVAFGTTTSKSAAAKALASSIQEIDGHFMHYDSGAYDWMYVTTDSSLAAKLTGLDPKTDYLTWGVLDKESLGNIKINASASAIEFDAQSSTNNDFTVTYTQGDMPHATAHFNSLTASMAKSTSALIQAIYTINSFLYTDPSVTDLATFKDRKAQVDKALAVLDKYTQHTLDLTGEPDKASSLKRRMLLSRTDYSAEEINAIVNKGNVNKPIATLMDEYKINAQEAKKILDGAMNELSTNYKAEASWWDLAARAANLVSNTAQLTCTVLGATLAAGPATVAAGGLTIAQTAVLAVTSTEALVKTAQAGVELIIGEDVNIKGTLVASARNASGFINDFVAIDKLFNEPDKLFDNMIYVGGKGANLLWDKKVTFFALEMEVTDKDMIKVFDEVEAEFEDRLISALLPGTYHMPDGTRITILELPGKVIQILEGVPEADKVDAVKKITKSCPFHQKVLGDVCVNKICQIDDYNCPKCTEDEELKFKADGSGYCEPITASSSSSSSEGSCTPPECCAEAPQACGSQCIWDSDVCCGDGNACKAGSTCILDGCCPVGNETCGGTVCVDAGSVCCSDGTACAAGSVCVTGGCCSAEKPQVCAGGCISADLVCCGDHVCSAGSTCTSTGCEAGCPADKPVICNGSCMPTGAVCCSDGGYCVAGTECCGDLCMPAGSVCFGDTYCMSGYFPCAGGCVADGSVCCGDYACPAGNTCVNFGTGCGYYD